MAGNWRLKVISFKTTPLTQIACRFKHWEVTRKRIGPHPKDHQPGVALGLQSLPGGGKSSIPSQATICKELAHPPWVCMCFLWGHRFPLTSRTQAHEETQPVCTVPVWVSGTGWPCDEKESHPGWVPTVPWAARTGSGDRDPELELGRVENNDLVFLYLP